MNCYFSFVLINWQEFRRTMIRWAALSLLSPDTDFGASSCFTLVLLLIAHCYISDINAFRFVMSAKKLKGLKNGFCRWRMHGGVYEEKSLKLKLKLSLPNVFFGTSTVLNETDSETLCGMLAKKLIRSIVITWVRHWRQDRYFSVKPHFCTSFLNVGTFIWTSLKLMNAEQWIEWIPD